MYSLFINIDQTKYCSLSLIDGLLSIQTKDGISEVLQENVEHVSVSIFNDQLRIIAFLDKDYALFLWGNTSLSREKIDLGHRYGGGGQLVTDKKGVSHLLYLIKQSPGLSSILRHHMFDGTWSSASLVSTNVFSDGLSYTICCHENEILHVAYCNHRGNNLLYRAYNPKHKMWSGAVSFSKGKCSYPQFVSTEKLYLFWFEENDKTRLKVRVLDEIWSPISVVSSNNHHASNMGFATHGGERSVYWVEEGKLYKSLFERWNEYQQLKLSDFDYIWLFQDEVIVPSYNKKVEKSVSETVDTFDNLETEDDEEQQAPQKLQLETNVKKSQKEQQRENERKVQDVFVEKAFHTLKEWESLRAEFNQFKRDVKVPKPLDLTPLTTRVDRLEKRFFKWQQGEERRKQNVDASSGQALEEINRLKQRMRLLESENKKTKSSLWRRVLNRL